MLCVCLECTPNQVSYLSLLTRLKLKLLLYHELMNHVSEIYHLMSYYEIPKYPVLNQASLRGRRFEL